MTAQSATSNASAPTQSSSLTQWLDYMQQIHVSAIDMGLSRVLPVAQQLGITQSAKKDAYVFTVAGTNGKGSTTTIISEICRQAGYKTALYQSPHLLAFNERVRIDGTPVMDATLIDAFCQVEQARQDCQLTLSFFEMTTLAALLIFAQANCSVWVLEVGLGGRLDVINIIDPDLAVITNIGIDHVDWLGDTREKIGFEKAGILRPSIPLIYGETDMPVSVQDKIDELEVTCFQVGQDFDYYSEDEQKASCDSCQSSTEPLNSRQLNASPLKTWQFSSAAVTLQLPVPALSLQNTVNAVAAVLASRLNIQSEHIETALKSVKLAGRFDRRNLVNRHWLFDVAHNEQGVAFMLAQFAPFWQQHSANFADAKLHLVFSMLADKDIAQVVTLLTQSPLPIASWHIAEIDHPRAASIAELQATLSQNNVVNIAVYESLKQATTGVINASSTEDLILVCGSFHTIGEVLKALQ